jgi:hypothetical protein
MRITLHIHHSEAQLMATLKLKPRSAALLERAGAVQAKDKAVASWVAGKTSKAEMGRQVSKANEKLRT